jgi:hypothetical protein
MTAMTISNSKEQFILRVNQEVSAQLDKIIEKMQTLAENFSIQEDTAKSPFKNVLSVSTDLSTSLEVIKNFIRYQVGRQGASDVWKKKGFANALVQDIDSLSGDADAILARIKQSCHDENSSEKAVKQYIEQNTGEIIRSLHLQLAQLYLGYLSREHTARLGEKPNQSQEDNSSSEALPQNKKGYDKPNRKPTSKR